ncbi:MAG: Ppx/GppA phosphatase family protein [Bacteroidota bacterium]
MLLAAIDIGSNAVRLFFSNVYKKEKRVVVEKASLMRVPVRLGADVFLHHRISKEKEQELIKTLKAFQLLIEVIKPVAVRACATSAMREAYNKEEVIKHVATETGLNIEIIDGVEEAKIVSSVQNIDLLKDYEYSLYVDVGGGSTELSLISHQGTERSHSFKIGTVRMLNKKVKKKEWEHLEKWLKDIKDSYPNVLCVGVGGNINKIARLYGREPDKNLPFTNMEYAFHHLRKFSVEERIHLMGMRPDRADVIVPAAQIFHFIMKAISAPILVVPRIGLADGIVNLMYRELSSG